jgi:hypothetical protein
VVFVRFRLSPSISTPGSRLLTFSRPLLAVYVDRSLPPLTKKADGTFEGTIPLEFGKTVSYKVSLLFIDEESTSFLADTLFVCSTSSMANGRPTRMSLPRRTRVET